jgi:hypothetical protein
MEAKAVGSKKRGDSDNDSSVASKKSKGAALKNNKKNEIVKQTIREQMDDLVNDTRLAKKPSSNNRTLKTECFRQCHLQSSS